MHELEKEKLEASMALFPPSANDQQRGLGASCPFNCGLCKVAGTGPERGHTLVSRHLQGPFNRTTRYSCLRGPSDNLVRGQQVKRGVSILAGLIYPPEQEEAGRNIC